MSEFCSAEGKTAVDTRLLLVRCTLLKFHKIKRSKVRKFYIQTGLFYAAEDNVHSMGVYSLKYSPLYVEVGGEDGSAS